MLQELLTGDMVVGVKQSRRAIQNGHARQVFLAQDADPGLTEPLKLQCMTLGIPVTSCCSMLELGEAAGIQVGAAVVALLKKDH